MVSPEFIKHLILSGKIAGAFSALGGFVYGCLKGPIRWVKQVADTNQNVNLLISNHLPHLSDAVNAQADSLNELKADVVATNIKMDGISQRLDDTKASVHALGEAFVRHLENVSQAESKAAATPVTPASNKT